MLWSAYFGMFEAMRLMRAAGVDADLARQALRSSSADSWARSMWPRVRPVWAQDDLAIAKLVADRVGVPVPVLTDVADAFATWPDPETFYLEGGAARPAARSANSVSPVRTLWAE